jgi:hypothetical protein
MKPATLVEATRELYVSLIALKAAHRALRALGLTEHTEAAVSLALELDTLLLAVRKLRLPLEGFDA